MLQKSIIGIMWRISNLILGAFFRIFSVKMIGINGSGRADYLVSISSIFLIFFLFGFNTYLSKNLIYLNDKEKKDMLSNALFITLIFFSIGSVVIIPIMLYLSFNIKEIIFIIFTNISFIMSELIYAYYIGLEESNKANFYNFLTGLAHGVIFYLMVVLYKGTLSMYFISLIASYFIVQIMILKNKITFKKMDLQLLKLSFSLYIPSIVYGLFPTLSRVLHKIYSTERSLFIFSTSIAFLNLLNTIPLVLTSSYAPLVSLNFKKNNFQDLKRDIQRIIRLSFLIVIPLFIMIFFNSKPILEFLLIDSHKESCNMLILISAVSFFRIFTLTGGLLLNMCGREKMEIFNGAFKLIVFTLFIPLSSSLNMGAVIAYMLAEAFLAFVKFVQIKRIFKISMINLKTLTYFIIVFSFNFLFFSKIAIFEGAKLFYLGGLSVGVVILFNLLLSPFNDSIVIKEFFSIFKLKS